MNRVFGKPHSTWPALKDTMEEKRDRAADEQMLKCTTQPQSCWGESQEEVRIHTGLSRKRTCGSRGPLGQQSKGLGAWSMVGGGSQAGL